MRQQFQFIVTVLAEDAEIADAIMNERISIEEDYPELGDPQYEIGYRSADRFDTWGLAQAVDERITARNIEQDRIREMERIEAAQAQDLDALPCGRIYLDGEGDPWYKDVDGAWAYDPSGYYAEEEALVLGDRAWSEDKVRANGPFTLKD